MEPRSLRMAFLPTDLLGWSTEGTRGGIPEPHARDLTHLFLGA